MQDRTREELISGRPGVEAWDAVGFCLSKLFEDKTRGIRDSVVEDLTYEELIGALLLAQDRLSK